MKLPIYLKVVLLLIGFALLFIDEKIAFAVVIGVNVVELVLHFLSNKDHV